MNRYILATVPLAMLGHMSYASIKAESHAHRKAIKHHVQAVDIISILLMLNN